MNFFIITVAIVAGVTAEADPQVILGGAALPYAATAVVATPPDTPASTVKTAPVAAIAAPAIAAPLPAVAAAPLGYAGLGYAGLGYAGLGYAGLGYAGLGYAGLGYAGLGYGAGLPYVGRKKREAEPGVLLPNGAPNALPVVTIPEPATTGYAVGASGAIGGQGPVAAVAAPAVATIAAPTVAAPVTAVAAAPLGYAGLGYAGLGYAGLGYAGLGHAGLGYSGLAYGAGLGLYGRKKREADPSVLIGGAYAGIPALSYAAAPVVIGKSAPCVNVANVPVPCAAPGLALGYAGLGYAGHIW